MLDWLEITGSEESYLLCQTSRNTCLYTFSFFCVKEETVDNKALGTTIDEYIHYTYYTGRHKKIIQTVETVKLSERSNGFGKHQCKAFLNGQGGETNK